MHRLSPLRALVRLPESTRLRWTLVGLGVAALAGSPLALGAATKKAAPATHASLLTGTRNPKRGSVTASTTLAAKTSGYALKVSNTGLGAGGGLFSCGSLAGGTASNRPPCLRAANSNTGSVFEFSFRGALGGVFQIGNNIDQVFPAARPFVTNATGVATGLNADRVDGLHAQDIIDSAVARSSVQVGAQGPAGSAGPAGPQGPQGLQGQSGPAGVPFIGTRSTAGGNVLLPNRLNSSTDTSTGADLLPTPSFFPPLPADHTYLVQVTLRAFDTGSTSVTGTKHYAVAGLFLDGVLKQTLWSPDVPGDGNNAATASDTVALTVTSPAAGQLSLLAIDHTDLGAQGNSSISANATVTVTEVNAGS
jgi:hypothetical protein